MWWATGASADREARLATLILIALFTLPVVSPEKTAWLTGLVPLPVFYYLVRLGRRQGFAVIRNSLVVAVVAALLTKGVALLIFSLSLVLLGVVLFQAAGRGQSPLRAGLAGTVVLGATWIAFWAVLGLLQQVNPYHELRDALDQGLAGALTAYRDQSGLSDKTWQEVEATVADIRQIMPRVLPALLIIGLFSTVLCNQLLGNWLLKKTDPALAPWPDLMAWHLPDHLVWGVIAGGALMLLPDETAGTVGLNILLVWGALYCLQGTAVLSGLFQRWTLPQPVRVLVFAFVMIQSFGIMLLTVLGLIDVWADFRKIKKRNDHGNNTQTNR